VKVATVGITRYFYFVNCLVSWCLYCHIPAIS